MKISFIVLTNNSEEIINHCLDSITWADEIIVFDDNSSDQTLKFAKKYTDKTYSHKLDTFSNQRNRAFQKATKDWVFFLDSDERVSQKLKQEIQTQINNTPHAALRLKRQNYFFGQKVKAGGYWPDWQTRLFKRDYFKAFSGDTHETPHFKGSLGSLSNHLIHFSHRNLQEGLRKSMTWTKKEAKAFINANHPSITWWRLPKVMMWEFCFRFFKKQGFKDGYIGFVEAIIQAINKFFIYQQVWEMQQQPSLQEQYQLLEKSLK